MIYVVQNLFEKGPESRTVSLNAHYMVIFKNPRDASQISHLARQMYPGRGKYLQEAFVHATSKPYGYLLVDARQETPEHLRLRTKIFSGPVANGLRQKSIKGRTTRHWLTHFFVMMSTCRRESLRYDDAEEEENFPLRKVAEHALDLHYLAHAKPEICQNIVRHADNSLIHCLAECCEKVLYGHVDLTRNQKRSRTLSGMHEESSQEKSPREAEEGSLTSGRIFSGTSRSFGGFRHITLGSESSGLFMNLYLTSS